MAQLRGVLSVAVLWLCGCGAPPPWAARQQAIINGTVADEDRAVVLIIAQVAGSSSASLCTGEVISPHVVLTAAHCVAPSTVGNAQFFVFPGTTLPRPPPANELLSVQSTAFVPTFAYDAKAGTDRDDLGVVILAQPTEISPLPFNHLPLTQELRGQPARIVGYGLSDGSDEEGRTAGTRRQAPTTIFDVQPTTLALYDNMHSNCQGDSGGPVLLSIDGQEQIIGLTQVGYVGCPVNMAAFDTRVDPYVDFVDSIVAKYDPPKVAGGGRCSQDSDCTPLVCAATSLGQICQQPCDPDDKKHHCPSGTHCTDLDGQLLCVEGGGKGGCALADSGQSGALGLLLLAALWGLGWRARHRSRP